MAAATASHDGAPTYPIGGVPLWLRLEHNVVEGSQVFLEAMCSRMREVRGVTQTKVPMICDVCTSKSKWGNCHSRHCVKAIRPTNDTTNSQRWVSDGPVVHARYFHKQDDKQSRRELTPEWPSLSNGATEQLHGDNLHIFPPIPPPFHLMGLLPHHHSEEFPSGL